MAYMPGLFFLFWLFFTSVFVMYCSPDFSFNILQIFSPGQWDLLLHLVIFFIRLYRFLLQINYTVFLVANFVLLSLLIKYFNPTFITPFWLCNIF
jgi:hypothetical protein